MEGLFFGFIFAETNILTMNKILLAFKLSFISLLLLSSCSEDDLTNETNSPITASGATPSSVLAQQTSNQEIAKVATKEVFKASVLVNVVDEFGAKVNGATVAMSDNSIDTENGVVIFNNIDLNKEYVGLKVTHPEFITAIKNFTPVNTTVYNLEVQLFKGEKKSFSSVSGKEIKFESGVALDFSNASIVNADGSIYEGTVNVNTYYHTPNDADYLQALPGALVGVDGEEISALVTEGMVTVDLRNASGEEVFLNEGASVKVTMPADADAPATIDLWHLNEKYGIWTKTGTAIKNGAVYEFEVNHFSTYNLDVPVDALEKVEFVVLGNDNFSLQNMLLELYVNGVPQLLVQSDISANFSIFNAPAGEYQLRAVLCETNKTILSNSVNVQQSDTYEFLIDLTEDVAVASKQVVFNATFVNCSNQTNPEDVLTLTLFKGTSNEKVILTRNYEFHFYYAQINECDFDTADMLDVEVNYNNGEYIGVKTFYTTSDNDTFALYSNERRDVSICDAAGGAVAELDASLEAYIKHRFGFSDSYVITSELTSQIKSLNLTSFNQGNGTNVYFENFDFNQIATYFPNLESLSIELNPRDAFSNEESLGKFLNFEHISSLQKLSKIALVNGSINDITPLASLTNLTELTLDNNNLSDLTIISELNNLQVLDVGSNTEVKNFNFLNNLTQLESLYLTSMGISEISFLSNVSSNLINLSLSYNEIIDASIISRFVNLEGLYVRNNSISDTSFLSSLTNLLELQASFNNVSDIAALSQVASLVSLDVSNNNISDIAALSQVTSLVFLDVSNNNVTDISSLAGLTKLISIKATDNNISIISALEKLLSLQILVISNNPISDISVLSNLRNLEGLLLEGANISDLKPLFELTRLHSLHLNNNPIEVEQLNELRLRLPSTMIYYNNFWF